MAKGATSRSNHSLNLSLLILLSYLGTTLSDEDASFCYNFKVSNLAFGQWRNEVTGLLNTQICFLYKDNKCYDIGHGTSINAIEICENQFDTLKDGVDIFKGPLLKIKENKAIREPLTLQAYICCNHEGGSWRIILNGKSVIPVETNTGNLTELELSFKEKIDMWSKEREVAGFLNMTTQGDCGTWLDELQKEYPQSTGSTMKMLDTTQPTYATQNHSILNITKPTYGTHNQPTANITQDTSGAQSLSPTEIVVFLCIPVGLILITVIFYIIKMLKKQKVLPAAPLPL